MDILKAHHRAVLTAKQIKRVLAEERMDLHSVGPCNSLVVNDLQELCDDWACEPAELSSVDAFRAQVRAWREAMDL